MLLPGQPCKLHSAVACDLEICSERLLVVEVGSWEVFRGTSVGIQAIPSIHSTST